MSESYIQQKFAGRIGGSQFGKDTKIYKFEKIKRAKEAARKAHPGVELIDMGVGEPDEKADDSMIAELAKAAADPSNRGYADNGTAVFKEAAARYMDKVFGVAGIDPASEVCHCIGMKPALAMFPLTLINPGDVTIMTVPGYPVLGTHTAYLGGEVYNLKLTPERNFLPDLGSIPADVLKRAKLLYLNYPNNPTGATATRAFFEEAVAFAKKHQLVVLHDAAYAALVYDGNPPLSFLSVPGAKEVGVEMHSLSKSYNMTGWRIGFVTGNPLLVKAYATVKDNIDSGQFKAIQQAAAYGLDRPEITRKIAEKYSRRMNKLVKVLGEAGFKVKKPGGSFFLYTAAPRGIEGGRDFANAEEFSQYMITEKLVSTVPWDDAGAFVRFSVTFECAGPADEDRVIGEIAKRLSGTRFRF